MAEFTAHEAFAYRRVFNQHCGAVAGVLTGGELRHFLAHYGPALSYRQCRELLYVYDTSCRGLLSFTDTLLLLADIHRSERRHDRVALTAAFHAILARYEQQRRAAAASSVTNGGGGGGGSKERVRISRLDEGGVSHAMSREMMRTVLRYGGGALSEADVRYALTMYYGRREYTDTHINVTRLVDMLVERSSLAWVAPVHKTALRHAPSRTLSIRLDSLTNLAYVCTPRLRRASSVDFTAVDPYFRFTCCSRSVESSVFFDAQRGMRPQTLTLSVTFPFTKMHELSAWLQSQYIEVSMYDARQGGYDVISGDRGTYAVLVGFARVPLIAVLSEGGELHRRLEMQMPQFPRAMPPAANVGMAGAKDGATTTAVASSVGAAAKSATGSAIASSAASAAAAAAASVKGGTGVGSSGVGGSASGLPSSLAGITSFAGANTLNPLLLSGVRSCVSSSEYVQMGAPVLGVSFGVQHDGVWEYALPDEDYMFELFGDRMRDDLARNGLRAQLLDDERNGAPVGGGGGGVPRHAVFETLYDHFRTFYTELRKFYKRRRFRFIFTDEYDTFRCLCQAVHPFHTARPIDNLKAAAGVMRRIDTTSPLPDERSHFNSILRVGSPSLLLQRRQGTPLECAVLLCNMFLGMGARAFIAFGSHERVPCVWVVTLHDDDNRQWMTRSRTKTAKTHSKDIDARKFWHRPNGRRGGNGAAGGNVGNGIAPGTPAAKTKPPAVLHWSVTDGAAYADPTGAAFPWTCIDALVNNENIWCNLQLRNAIAATSFLLDDPRGWITLLTPDILAAFGPIEYCYCQPTCFDEPDDPLYSAFSTECVVRDLVDALAAYRRDVLHIKQTQWFRPVCQLLQTRVNSFAEYFTAHSRFPQSLRSARELLVHDIDALLPDQYVATLNCYCFNTDDVELLAKHLVRIGQFDNSTPHALFAVGAATRYGELGLVSTTLLVSVLEPVFYMFVL